LEEAQNKDYHSYHRVNKQMAADSDTLNLGTLNPHREHLNNPGIVHMPQHNLHPAIHPDAAAAARQRIAAIHEPKPFINAHEVPAAPTADLIINKTALAQRASTKPQVAREKQHQLPSIVQPLLTAVGIFLLTLLLFKAPIIISQIQYSLGNKSSSNAANNATTASVVSSADTLTIPKINVQAPVNYINTNDENAIETALESGVIHYSSTALPGQNGNVAIFGHSSNDWWQPGNFKFVFVLLDKLSPGDLVYIDYNGTRYTYQVTASQVVQPTDMAVLDPTSTPTLSLITCTPPGTSLERLVVTAKQISPSPSANGQSAPPSPAPQSQQASLPSAAPGFMSQVASAWNSLTESVKSLFGGANTNTNNTPNTSGQTELPATQ
jgi:LPXTG-site transpeptidase (sortase) family protein